MDSVLNTIPVADRGVGRIAVVLPSLDGGGAERVMVTLANAFAARGYGVDLVLAAAHGPYLSDVLPKVRIIDLKAGRVLRAVFPLLRYLRRERPVAVLSAMNHVNVITVMACMFARLSTRLVVSEHSTINEEAARNRNVFARVVYALIPGLYRRAAAVLAVSEAAARDLERFAHFPQGSVRAIYNPFDLERISRMAMLLPEHPWLAPGQPPVLLAIGRLTEAKDFSTLIRAFSLMRAKHGARLLILGEGELRGALQDVVDECGLTPGEVQMPGFVSNPFAYLSRSAAFVLSSRWEGFGNVLVEALACGAPVISTDCPSGPCEILEDGRWGQLVPAGDVQALAQAMDFVLSSPRGQLPDARGRAKEFDQERAVDAYLDALGLPPWPAGHVARPDYGDGR